MYRQQRKEKQQMTANEETLLSIIRENDNPEQALQIAIEIITTFLEQSVSSQEPSVDFLPVLD